MSQEELDECWMRIAEKFEEEVLDKYKVKNSEREAYKGRGAHPEWRLVRRCKKYRLRKWGEDCWTRIFLSSECTICSESKACRMARRRRKR